MTYRTLQDVHRISSEKVSFTYHGYIIIPATSPKLNGGKVRGVPLGYAKTLKKGRTYHCDSNRYRKAPPSKKIEVVLSHREFDTKDSLYSESAAMRYKDF